MKSSHFEFELNDFPTTRYQGSKRKILNWIFEKLDTIEFNTALDAFGGTGSVSYLLKKMGKEVTYNDKYKFNSIIGKAIIENDNVKLSAQDLNYLLGKHKYNEYYTVIQDNFSSIYYLDEENIWLDKLISNILQFENYQDNEHTKFKKELAYYAIFQACLMKRPFNLFHRKNLNLRTNEVERTFGNKTTWEKPFEDLFINFVSEANNLVFNSKQRCTSINKSVLDLEQINYDLVYLDPPYLTSKSKNETSDYLRCYHFLEGISRYKEWVQLIDYNTKNLGFINTIESNDFKPSVAPELFSELISKFKKSIIILSYKVGGIPSIDQLVELIEKHKSNVEIYSQHYKYALNNQNGDASMNREVLIVAR